MYDKRPSRCKRLAKGPSELGLTSKAPEDRRIPKPGGLPTRACVLECGCPLPLCVGRTWLGGQWPDGTGVDIHSARGRAHSKTWRPSGQRSASWSAAVPCRFASGGWWLGRQWPDGAGGDLQSARGRAHSKTWRPSGQRCASWTCGRPLPLGVGWVRLGKQWPDGAWGDLQSARGRAHSKSWRTQARPLPNRDVPQFRHEPKRETGMTPGLS